MLAKLLLKHTSMLLHPQGLCLSRRKHRPTSASYLVYVRPLLEFNSVSWSPHTVKDITAIESDQRRFTKRLTGCNTLCYRNRLQRLSIPNSGLRCLQADLFWCYKIVIGVVDLNFDEFFEWSPLRGTRGHEYKLHKVSRYTD